MDIYFIFGLLVSFAVRSFHLRVFILFAYQKHKNKKQEDALPL